MTRLNSLKTRNKFGDFTKNIKATAYFSGITPNHHSKPSARIQNCQINRGFRLHNMTART